MSSWGYIDPRRAAQEAPLYAQKAVALAPTLPEPHISLGNAQCNLNGRYDEGLVELRRALELNRSLGVTHYFLAICLVIAGRPREALAEGFEAQRLEPLNAQFSTGPGRAYIALDKPDSAITIFMKATTQAPALGSPYASMLWAYAEKGDPRRVVWSAENVSTRSTALTIGTKAFSALFSHDTAGFAALRSEINQNLGAAAIYVAAGYSYARDADSTMAWLNRSYEVKSDVLGLIEYPMFDWIRSDPRYPAFQKKYNIATPRR